MTLDLHLIGGCSSSGTTLLAHVLDGLHDLRVGPEYGAFHHRRLYRDDGFQRELYRTFMGQPPGSDVTVGNLRYALVPAAFLMERGFYGVEGLDEEFDLLMASTHMPGLVAELKRRFAVAQGIGQPFVWIDQTPKNCIAALEFLRSFPEAKFIHVVRDGRDVMVSLLNRYRSEYPGHSDDTYLTIALIHWVYDVAQARRAAGEAGYLEVRYEEFVTEPLLHTNRILRHLGRPEIDRETLDGTRSPTESSIGTRMQGGDKPSWTARPSEPISTRAVGRWKRELPRSVLQAALDFRFTPPGEDRELGFRDTLALCNYC